MHQVLPHSRIRGGQSRRDEGREIRLAEVRRSNNPDGALGRQACMQVSQPQIPITALQALPSPPTHFRPGGKLPLGQRHLSNRFWSLRLPEASWGAFRVSDGEGGVFSFRCLPFGWKYSAILCQKVFERLIEEIGLVGVLVFIYIDDVLIVGRGKARVLAQARRAVEALRVVGGVICPKSTLETVIRLVLLGKDADPGGGSLQTAGNT